MVTVVVTVMVMVVVVVVGPGLGGMRRRFQRGVRMDRSRKDQTERVGFALVGV